MFSLLGIFLTVMGLLGLSSFTAEQKKKEIAIRKVLGATEKKLLAMLFNDYFVLWAIAFVIAMPVAWYFTDE